MGKKTRSKKNSVSDFVPPPATPLEAAEDLIYEAWEASSARRRVSLAKKALELSPDCADAYLILAGATAKTLDDVIGLCRKGVEAGERALGKSYFEEEVGYFWGLIETRPYMRARAGLAAALWLAKSYDEAVGHYWDMLRLNPDDNQGIRDRLMSHLLELGRADEAERLFGQYEDECSATWEYSRALLDFLKEGDSKTARKSLKDAIEANAHVPGYLLDPMKMPPGMPGLYSLGDENEAQLYVIYHSKAWQKAPGALDWLRARTARG